MKMLPRPLFLLLGSRCDHMMRIGLPLMGVKFSASSARAAAREGKWVVSKQRVAPPPEKRTGLRLERPVVVDVGVAERAAGHGVAAHADAADGANLRRGAG